MNRPHNVRSTLCPSLLLALCLIAACSVVVVAQQPAESVDQKRAKAVQLYLQGDTEEAVKLFRVVVKKYPDDAEAWSYLALALNSEGLFGQARPALEQWVRLRPDSADAHAKLAFALILGNESEKAISTGKRAAELGDQSPEAHYAIAEGLFRTGNPAEALREADATLSIKADFPPALITKSLVQCSLKQYGDAASSLEKFLAASPNDVDAEIWRGQMEALRKLSESQSVDSDQSITGKEATQKARVMSKPEPSYTEAARKAGVTGTVVLRAVFSSDGQVKNIMIAKALGYGLTTRAIQAARKIEFTPAIKDGRQVSMFIELQYSFNLY